VFVRLHTVGHSNRTIDDLLAILAAHGIGVLVDVRSFPRSRRNPQFNRDALEVALAAVGAEYVWLGPEVGGLRRGGVEESPHTAIEDPLFRAYADHTHSAEFARGVSAILELAGRRPTAVMCAEKEPRHCHRSYLADVLVALHGVEVLHLTDAGPGLPHRLRDSARIAAGHLLYDVRPGGTQLPLF